MNDHALVDEIKDALDIVEVAEKYRSITHIGGGEYGSATDLSNSKSGQSLKINKHKQWFNDFATDASGDVLDLIGHFEGLDTRGLDFPQVLQIAADYAGVELPEQDDESKQLLQERQEVQTLYTDVTEHYHEELLANPELIEHIKDKWGIDKETIDSLKIGYAPVENALNKFKGPILDKSGLILKFKNRDIEFFNGRIIFPYWKNGKVVYMIARRVEGYTPDTKYEEAKYKKLLTPSEKHPYISPVAGNNYLYGEDSIRQATDWILITEGVTDCITAIQSGIPAISPVTIQFREADHDKIKAAARRVDTVYICNDNEESGAGLKGALATADMLEEAGVMVKMVTLPRDGKDKIDLAEYLQEHSKEDFEDLLEEAPDTWIFKLEKVKVPKRTRDKVKVLKRFISEDLKYKGEIDKREFIKSDVAEYFGVKQGPINDILKAAATNATIEAADEDREVSFFDDSNRLKPETLALYLMEQDRFITMTDNGRIYRYCNGVYVPDGEDFINSKVLDLLGDAGRQRHCFEVIHQVKNRTRIQRTDIQQDINRICLLNGIYNRNTGQLEEHNPDEIFITQLPIEYDPKATCPAIDRFLSEILRPDDIKTVLELIGYCTIPDYSIGKAAMFYGSGANGKSVLLNLISAFLDHDNISRVSLQQISEDKHAAADLYGKLANVYPDIPDRAIRDQSSFKMLTGDEAEIRAERKYEQSFKFKNVARLIFSANDLPQVAGANYAFFRRWLLISFPNTFEGDDADKNLIDKLATREELAGLFNQVMYYLDQLLANGGFTGSGTTEDVEREYIIESDPVAAFVDECVYTVTEEETVKTNLHIAYKEWCEAHGIEKKTKNILGKDIKRLGFIGGKAKQYYPDGTRPHVWFNCAIDHEAMSKLCPRKNATVSKCPSYKAQCSDNASRDNKNKGNERLSTTNSNNGASNPDTWSGCRFNLDITRTKPDKLQTSTQESGVNIPPSLAAVASNDRDKEMLEHIITHTNGSLKNIPVDLYAFTYDAEVKPDNLTKGQIKNRMCELIEAAGGTVKAEGGKA
jgi:DNA primase catalytic core